MLALISFIGIVVISMIIIRVGTIALVLTGLSHEVASFQAQSASLVWGSLLRSPNLLLVILLEEKY